MASLNARLEARAAGVETTIDSVIFLNGLAADIQAVHLEQRPIALTVGADPHPIPIDAAKPLGLILNELVLNALKYAFPEGQAGEITIDFRCQGSDCVLTVQDNGIGLDATAPPQGTGLGLRMVRALTEQIGGVYEIAPARNGGTIGTVRWPVIGGSPTG